MVAATVEAIHRFALAKAGKGQWLQCFTFISKVVCCRPFLCSFPLSLRRDSPSQRAHLARKCQNAAYLPSSVDPYNCESKPSFAGPPDPLLHNPLSRPVVTYLWHECLGQVCPKKNLVAKVLVASQEILLQTYVAEWPPKHVTHPVLLIHGHIISQWPPQFQQLMGAFSAVRVPGVNSTQARPGLALSFAVLAFSFALRAITGKVIA